MLSVMPEYCLAASTALYAEPSAGPSVDAFMASACAWPSGVEGSARSSAAWASAMLLTEVSSGPDRASMPVIWPKRLMKVRRVGSPLSQASSSADSPASKSLRSRSFISSSSLSDCRSIGSSSRRGLAFARPRIRVGRRQPIARPCPSSMGEARPEILNFSAPGVACQHGPVDHAARLAPLLHIEHGAHVGGAVAGKTLVGPAERVRRQDDVVEFQDRVVRIGRLLLQHVEAGAGDAPFLQHFRERLLVDDGAAR